MDNRRFSSWLLERTVIGDTLRLRIGISKIGRHSSSAIRIVNGYVSRNHAEIEVSCDDKTVILRDLESVNGIYVNNVLYKQTYVKLNPGDRVGIGVYKTLEDNDPELDLPIYVIRYAPLRTNSSLAADTSNGSLNKTAANIKTANDASTANLNVNEQLTIAQTSCQYKQNVPTANEATSAAESAVAEKDANTSCQIHVPILPVEKVEHMHCVTANVEEIFGAPDDLVLEHMKHKEPLVYLHLKNKLQGKEQGSSDTLLRNGECITISDEDDEEEEEEILAVILPPLPKAVATEPKRTNSPTVFDTSLNSSTDNDFNNMANQKVETADALHYMANQEIGDVLNNNAKKELESVDKMQVVAMRANEDAYTHEDLLFSQTLLSNMKDEFFDADDDKEEQPLENDCDAPYATDDDILFSQTVLKAMKTEICTDELKSSHSEEEPHSHAVEDPKDFQHNDDFAAVKPEPADEKQIWQISDDEDYDQEFEEKVNGWSNKLLSQNLLNKSQIYDINYSSDDTNDSCSNEVNQANDDLYGTNHKQTSSNTGIFDDIFSTINAKLQGDVSSADSIDSSARKAAEPEVKTDVIDFPQSNEADAHKKHSQREETAEAIASAENKANVSKLAATTAAGKTKATYKEELLQEKIKESKQNSKQICTKIIDAPHLPTHKGKHRGVSAETSKSLQEKYKSARDKLANERQLKDLKQKWVEKPSNEKRRKKENDKIIKENRQQKLKELAKKHATDEASNKRKLKDDHEDSTNSKKAKVKITHMNRAAMLAEELEKQPQQPAFRIPKKVEKKHAPSVPAVNPNQKPLAGKKPSDNVTKSTAELGVPEPAQADCNQPMATTFSQVLSSIDKNIVVRPSKKLSFASMHKNFEENHACVEKIKRSSMTKPQLPQTLSSTSIRKPKNNKKVRFNDIPTVYHIERVIGANRKVNWKDVLPLTTYKDRCRLIRQKYAIVDYSDKILNNILCWSNEWLNTKNADVIASSEIINPLPSVFSSYEQYKSAYLTFMKLEYQSMLEMEYNSTKFQRLYKGTLMDVIPNKDRITFIIKLNAMSKAMIAAFRIDIVLVAFHDINISRFAYVSKARKGTESITLVLDMLAETFTREHFRNCQDVELRGVVDNIRVEFGVYNAVYQLKETPLFQQILKPLELLNCKTPKTRNFVYKAYDPLNSSQMNVLMNTYYRVIDEHVPNITLIKGPPGTGKSCVISNLALQCLYGKDVRIMDKKILICAQSNCAVDVIAAKLYRVSQKMRPETRFRIIRFGVPERIAENLQDITLQNIAQRDRIRKMLAHNKIALENKSNIKDQILLLETQIMEIKRTNYVGTCKEDELIEKERQVKLLHNVLNQVLRPEEERNVYSWYLNNANIVCTTLSSCVKLSTYMTYFDICVIDEATQCTEPWTLLPLKFGINSLVLVGDTQQLPATVLSRKAYQYGLGTSMFTRIQNSFDSKTNNSFMYTLRVQYRMHPEICKWPNLYFYNRELENAAVTMKCKSPILPYAILSLTYNQNNQCSNGKITNIMEAEFVGKLLRALNEYLPITNNTYGVITPYAHHRNALESVIKNVTGFDKVMVNTIDSYQGIEKDVIIISNARTNGIGFLSNYQRLNVALTRPKKCLLLCGNFKSLESVPVWRSLLQNARERKLYFELTENSQQDIQRNVIKKLLVNTNT